MGKAAEKERKVQRVSGAIEVDAELCRGCQACQLACSLHHEGQCHLGLARVQVRKDMVHYTFDISICRHCEEPACVAACPVGAITLDERGVAVIDDGECTRCGSCAAACPYDAIFYSEAEDRYLKCDLCAGRAEGPLCVALCPVRALTLGEDGSGGQI
jgi:Fe-S-cluster-containing dehydrogenase component